jgi:uncharacterized repeat protein (TIGR01451 family)
VISNAATWGGGLYLDRSSAELTGNVILTNTGVYGGGFVSSDGSPRLVRNTVRGNEADYAGGLLFFFGSSVLQGNSVVDNRAEVLGGGLYVQRGAPLLRSNRFRGNRADWGGGMYMDGGTGTLAANDLISNVAETSGGGIYLYRAGLKIVDSAFVTNQATYGGGLYSHESDSSLQGNLFRGNFAAFDGGGYGGAGYFHGSRATLTNTIAACNQAASLGSGFYVSSGSDVRLLQTTLVGEPPGEARRLLEPMAMEGDGTALYLASGSAALTNTILVAHTRGVYVSAGSTATLQSTLLGASNWANETDYEGPGSLSHTADLRGDPAFVAPEAGDYHLRQTSAARDAGMDSGVEFDVDGDPRPVGDCFDLGADEWTVLDLSSSGKSVSVSQADVGDVLKYTLLLRNDGLSPSINTAMYDPIPVQTSLISGSSSATAGLVTESSGIYWFGTLTPHQPVTVTYRVTLNEAVFVENTALLTDQHGVSTTLRAEVNRRYLYVPLVLRPSEASDTP